MRRTLWTTYNALKVALVENLRSITEEVQDKHKKLSRRVLVLQGEQDAVMEKNIKGVVDDDTARRIIAEKKKQIIACEQERALLPNPSQQTDKVIEFGLRVLQDPKAAWYRFSLQKNNGFRASCFQKASSSTKENVEPRKQRLY